MLLKRLLLLLEVGKRGRYGMKNADKGKKKEVLFFLLPSFFLLLGFGIFPIFFNIYLSLHDVTFITFVKGTSPFIGLENYLNVLNFPLFYRTLFNTLVFTTGSLFFQLLIGLFLAILFNKHFPLNSILHALIMLPWFIPIVASATVWRFLLSDTGIINGSLIYFLDTKVSFLTDPRLTIYSLTFANIWLGIPFNYILLLTGLKNISSEILESAELDGAGEWQKIRYIQIPLLKDVIVMTLLLGSLFTLKVFDLVWVMTRGGPGGATHLFSTLAYYVSFEHLNFGQGAVISIFLLIVMVPLIIAFLRIGEGGKEK